MLIKVFSSIIRMKWFLFIALYELIKTAGCEGIYDKPFAVRSSVYEAKEQNSHVGFFNEFYSPTQQRAQIEYNSPLNKHDAKSYLQVTTRKDRGTFYLDLSKNIGLEIGWNRVCKKMKLEQFLTKTRLNLIDIELEDNKLVFGTAKLLLIVEKFKIKLKKIGSTVTIRSIPAIPYELKLNGYPKLLVYFREVDKTTTIQSQAAPIKIVIQNENKAEIVVNYLYVNHLHEKGAVWMDDQQVTSKDAGADVFAFTPLTGCSLELIDQAEPIFKIHDELTKTKFSFRALVEYYAQDQVDPSVVKNMFVAFDKELQSMRVDTIGAEEEELIMSFKYHRLFHIVKSDSRPIATKPDHYNGFDCSVAPLNLTSNQETLLTSQLLIGAKQFVYLGKAIVKGFDADMYEATLQSLPVWLEPPIEVNSYNSKYNHNRTLSEYIITLYIKTRSSQADPIMPLMMNIIEIIAYEPMRPLAMVNFREFAWSLDDIAPNGDRSVDLFSVGEKCSSGLHSAQVEMKLYNTNPIDELGRNLQVESERNLALLTMMQRDLSIPAVHVYDINTKLILWNDPNSSKMSIAASFRIADHKQAVMRVNFVNATHPAKTTTKFKVGSFANCYLKSLHTGRDSVAFEYSRSLKTCSIDIDDEVRELTCGDDPNPTFLFQVRAEIDFVLSMNIESVAKSANINNNHNFIGIKVHLGNGHSEAEFQLKKFMLQRNQVTRRINTGNKEELIGASHIRGLGLSKSDFHSREWGLPATSDAFTHCKSLCATNELCESYSVCTKDAKFECIISNQSFRSSSVLQNLIEKVRKRPKIGSLLSVKADSGTELMLEARPSCELYNKEYMQFYSQVEVHSRHYHSESMVPAPIAREFCAKMCFDQNVKYFFDRANKKKTKQNNSSPRFCNDFDYVQSANLDQSLKKRFIINNSNDFEGYCFFSDDWYLTERKPFEDFKQYSKIVGLEGYRFKNDELFEKQHEVGLKRSVKTPEQQEAYEVLALRRSATEKEYEIMKDFHKRSENSQYVLVGDSIDCAGLCLHGYNRLWPQCASFDIYELVGELLMEGRAHYLCKQNTITVSDAMSKGKEDLIIRNYTESPLIHYEPLVYYKTDFEHLTFGDYQSVMEEQSLCSDAISSISTRQSSIVVFLIVLVGLILGSFCGLYLIKKRPYDLRQRRESTLTLEAVDDTPTNLFS